jgi:hypothetical protein
MGANISHRVPLGKHPALILIEWRPAARSTARPRNSRDSLGLRENAAARTLREPAGPPEYAIQGTHLELPCKTTLVTACV